LITNVPEALAVEIARVESGLVVLEGCAGGGKSCLADRLGELIPG
jgi:hypothetical protein